MERYKEDGTLIHIFETVKQGASTIVSMLLWHLDLTVGEYLEDSAISKSINLERTEWSIVPHMADMEAAERLWKWSEQMLSAK